MPQVTLRVHIFQQDSVIVSQQALEAWMVKYLIKPTEDQSMTTRMSPADHPAPQIIVLSDILCAHICLDPAKAGSMKRIRRVRLSMRIPRDCWYSFNSQT